MLFGLLTAVGFPAMYLSGLAFLERSKLEPYQIRQMFAKLNTYRSYSSSSVNIAAGYQPKHVEDRRKARKMEEQQLKPTASNKKFQMILPPPNVTGNLHLGHSLMATIQDVICRQKRLLGYDVQWIPGTDHAGIGTQVVVEKKIFKETGLTRHQLGRKKFIEEVWKWKEENSKNIIEDLQNLGCSLDWDKTYFTMDETRVNAVNLAFVKLFEEGLILRKEALVNWSCVLESAISDIEVDTIEIKEPTEIAVPGYKENITFGRIFDISYRVMNSKDNNEIIVSTTRPETILGDVAVAVHPEDERYRIYRESNDEIKLWHPFRNESIPIIFDTSVDREFGTGAVKITPAHDKNDFEIAKRHSLQPIQVFSKKGHIIDAFGPLSGLPRFKARTVILEELSAQNLLRDTKSHAINLPLCSRSKDVIEQMLLPQWFVHSQPLADRAIEVVNSGRINLYPDNIKDELFRWLTDCRDWCISRQLWWGHRIPAYFAKSQEGKEAWVAALTHEEALEKSRKILSSDNITIERDNDVLDTWFSSSLLPFSAFNWPKDEYQKSYPLDLMETGHDILFFWVARMIMLGLQLTDNIPFKNVLLNGIVCDAHGRKMSKSMGNVVTPQQVVQGASLQSLQDHIQNYFFLNSKELKKSHEGLQKMFPTGIQECGTDALRLTLCSHNIKSNFVNFDVSECYTNKRFLNKIWQATRYTLGAVEKINFPINNFSLNAIKLSTMDRWILSRLADTVEICSNSMDNYNLHTAVSALKTFFYSNFCDIYLEVTKPGIASDMDKAQAHCATLCTCLSIGLQTMSAFTPFITEELLQYLPQSHGLKLSTFRDVSLEDKVNDILNVCQSIRQLKSNNKISKKHDPEVHIFPQNENAFITLSSFMGEIKSLTLTNGVIIEMNDIPSSMSDKFTLFSSAGHLCSFGISTNSEYKTSSLPFSNINKRKLEQLEEDLAKYLTTISMPGYRKSASADIQKRHLEKIQQLVGEIRNIKRISC